MSYKYKGVKLKKIRLPPTVKIILRYNNIIERIKD